MWQEAVTYGTVVVYDAATKGSLVYDVQVVVVIGQAAQLVAVQVVVGILVQAVYVVVEGATQAVVQVTVVLIVSTGMDPAFCSMWHTSVCASPPSTMQARYSFSSSSSKQNISESSNFQQFPYEVMFNPSGSANYPNTVSVGIFTSKGSLIPLAASRDLKMWINTRSMMGYLLIISQTRTLVDFSIMTRNSAKNFLNWKSLKISLWDSVSGVNIIQNSGANTILLRLTMNPLQSLFDGSTSQLSLSSWKQSTLMFPWGSWRNSLMILQGLTRFSLKNSGQTVAVGNRGLAGGFPLQVQMEIPCIVRISSQRPSAISMGVGWLIPIIDNISLGFSNDLNGGKVETFFDARYGLDIRSQPADPYKFITVYSNGGTPYPQLRPF